MSDVQITILCNLIAKETIRCCNMQYWNVATEPSYIAILKHNKLYLRYNSIERVILGYVNI